MEGSLVLSRKPSSHALSSGRISDGSSSSFSECKVKEPIFYDVLATLENDQVHQVGEAEELDETESQVRALEEISLEMKVGWASCITKKRKEIENSANLPRSSRACGIKRMTLLSCPDASLELKLYLDPWAIKKRIQTSDVGHLSRLLLAANGVKKHILPLWDAGRIESIHNGVGAGVAVWDFDTKSEHQLIFKQWPSNGSYVFIGKWTKEFVMRRGLKKGDEIGLYWDQTNSRFNFTILKGSRS